MNPFVVITGTEKKKFVTMVEKRNKTFEKIGLPFFGNSHDLNYSRAPANRPNNIESTKSFLKKHGVSLTLYKHIKRVKHFLTKAGQTLSGLRNSAGRPGSAPRSARGQTISFW